MSLAILAQGTLFKVALLGASAGGGVTIPEVMKIGCPNSKFDLLDTTSHDSVGGFKEYIPGLIDGENATAEMNFVPSNAVHIGLRIDALARTKDAFTIVFPGAGAGSNLAFGAYIVGWPPVADAGAVLRNTMTAKVTGLQVWT